MFGGNIIKNWCEVDIRVILWCLKIDDDRFVVLQQCGKIGFGIFNWCVIEQCILVFVIIWVFGNLFFWYMVKVVVRWVVGIEC